jgi:hypothetical protein
VLASQLTACDLFGWLVIYLLRGWFLNFLSPAFAAASAEYAPMKKPREALEFDRRFCVMFLPRQIRRQALK